MSNPGTRILVLLCGFVCAGASRAERKVIEAPAMVINSFTLPQAACLPAKPLPPDQAVQLGLTGAVLVEYTVDADGRVGAISLERSTAHPALNEAVKRWLEGCPYAAGKSRRGRPIALRVAQLYIFKR
jgi:TonB family protein